MGNGMGSVTGDLTMTQGTWGLWMVESWMHCGNWLSSNTKTQIIQVWVNEFEAQEQRCLGTAYRLHAWSIPQGVKNALFFSNTVFSYIFEPLLAVITTRHNVNLHFSPLPVCHPSMCVCWAFLCVYMRTLWGEGGPVILDLAEAAQFVWHVEGED